VGITPRKRGLPAVSDIGSYLYVRVRKLQLADYYRPKAARMKRRLNQFKVAAYIAAERYEFQWIEFSRTAVQLRRLLDPHDSGDPEAPLGPDLAAACEQVISIQNEAWMAKWGEEGNGSDSDTSGP
jgi:hypothetical protein